MPEDYYPNPGGDEPQPTGTDTGAKEPADDSPEENTFLVPKDALGGKEPNPGDKCTFEIVKVHGDEVEVRYVGEEESDSEYGDKGTMKESLGDMDKMPMASMGE